MGSLKGKIAIVTGASQGIGEVTALKLAEAGAQLVLTARNAEKLNALKARAEKHHPGIKVLVIPGDTCKATDVQRVVDETLKAFDRIDILINNAGVAGKIALLQEISVEEIDRVIDTNLKGAMYWMRAVLPAMVHQHSGAIVNVNSVAGKTAYPYWSVYDASKFGLDAVTTAVREEQRSNNIKLISIHPGAVDTPIWNTINLDHEPNHDGMLDANTVAEAILYALTQPEKAMIEEIILTPQKPAL